MKKLNKEEIYINLQGKSEDELTDIQNVLIMFNEPTYRKDFKTYYNSDNYNYLEFYDGEWLSSRTITQNKQEVTIQQLKEILQPMEKFTPIAMKCTQEQFEVIKPKLEGIGKIKEIDEFTSYEYLINNYCNVKNSITNVEIEDAEKRTVHEEWNEEIFLKACGIEVDSLQQQLEKAKAEVKRIEDEIEESKIECWVVHNLTKSIYQKTLGNINSYEIKITDQELINKLNNLIK